jgi:hypothetical protein
MLDWLKFPTLERSEDGKKGLRTGRRLARYNKKVARDQVFAILILFILDQGDY